MSLSVLNRRTVLFGTSGLVLFARPVLAQIADATPFRLGVASGDPSADGFVIWTRLAPDSLALDGLGGISGPAKVKWSVYADDALKQLVARGEATTSPDSAHTVHVEVRGLKPDRFYWYRFEALGAQSAAGRGRTMPLETAQPQSLKLVYASCSHYEKGYFSAYRHMTDENPDFVMFLGDYIYEYSYKDGKDIVRQHEQAADIRTLAQCPASA